MRIHLESLVEAFLILIHFPSNVLKPFIPFDSINKNGQQKYPVVLVEHWFSRNVFHIAAKKYLERKGFVVYSLNCSMMRGTFEDSAENLKKFIDEKRLQNIILIGISAGATTALEYLQFKNGWEKTHEFISIGGALYGSPLARFFPFSKSLRELDPKSDYIKHLHSKPIKNPEKIITIRARHDNMVPGKYATLPGVKSITVDVVGHNLLHTFWLPTYQKVYSFSVSKG